MIMKSCYCRAGWPSGLVTQLQSCTSFTAGLCHLAELTCLCMCVYCRCCCILPLVVPFRANALLIPALHVTSLAAFQWAESQTDLVGTHPSHGVEIFSTGFTRIGPPPRWHHQQPLRSERSCQNLVCDSHLAHSLQSGSLQRAVDKHWLYILWHKDAAHGRGDGGPLWPSAQYKLWFGPSLSSRGMGHSAP